MSNDGPDHTKYSYQCSAIATLRFDKVFDDEYKKLKSLECNSFSSVFNDFNISRLFETFTYSPVILCLINSKNFEHIDRFINRYFFHLNLSNDKLNFDFENSNIDFSKFNKDSLYTISLSKSLKDKVNIYIEDEFNEFVKNEFLLTLKEHVGAMVIFVDIGDENISQKIYENCFRSYSDLVFVDKVNKNLYDTFPYLGCRTNVKIDINDYLMVIDRTTVWTDIKSYKINN